MYDIGPFLIHSTMIAAVIWVSVKAGKFVERWQIIGHAKSIAAAYREAQKTDKEPDVLDGAAIAMENAAEKIAMRGWFYRRMKTQREKQNG